MKYTKEHLDEMKVKLAELDCEVMDDDAMFKVAFYGNVGWDNMPDGEVIEKFEDKYGDDYYDDVEVVDNWLHRL